MSLIIKTLKPSKELLKFIDTYWYISNPSKQVVKEFIVPDGCMDIICKNSKLFVVGAMEKPKMVEINPGESSFGIRFRPPILPALIGVDAVFLTEKVVLLEDINRTLYDEIVKLKFNLNGIDEIDGFFESIISKIKYNKCVSYIADETYRRKGDICLREVLSISGLGSRQLERLFSKTVGYSPKKFINIVRFFCTYKDIMRSTDKLSLKAVFGGYYDQPHFNREFKKYAGFAPMNSRMSNFYNTKLSD